MLEAAVVARVKELLADIHAASGEDGVAGAARDLGVAQDRLDAAVLAFADLTAEPAAVERLRQLQQARDKARRRHDALVSTSAAATIAVTAGDWDDLHLAERRGLIEAVIERITVAPGRGLERVTSHARTLAGSPAVGIPPPISCKLTVGASTRQWPPSRPPSRASWACGPRA